MMLRFMLILIFLITSLVVAAGGFVWYLSHTTELTR